MTDVSGVVQWRPGARSGSQGRHRASVVRDNSSVRRRQRPHRARDRRSVPRSFGKEFAALLQHVRADSAGAQGILRPAGTHAKRRDGHNAWLTWFLECLGRAIDGAETLLASVLTKARFWERHRRIAPERPAETDPQSTAGWLRGQTHVIQMGDADEIIAGHGVARHRRSSCQKHPRQGRRRRSQHKLFTCRNRLRSTRKSADEAIADEVRAFSERKCRAKLICQSVQSLPSLFNFVHGTKLAQSVAANIDITDVLISIDAPS